MAADSFSTKTKTVESGPVGGEDTIAGRLDYLQKYEDMLDDPQYAEAAPPQSRQTLAQAIDAARSAYDKEKNTNDWLEVAQMLGRAGAQYGAAREGLNTGVNMSGLNFAPPIDYSKKTAGAFDQYQQSIKNAGTLSDAGRQESTDQNAVKRQEFNKRAGMYKEGIDAMRDAEKNQVSQTTETARTQRDDARAADQNRKLEIAELNQQEKDYENQLRARQAISNQAAKEGDIDSKSLKKLAAQSPELAAKADLDLDILNSEMEKTDKPGRFFGTNPDPGARQKILQDQVSKTKNLLDAIKQRKQELIRDSSASPQESSKSKAPAPKSMTSAQLEAYSKQYNMPVDEARSYLQSQGYTVK